MKYHNLQSNRLRQSVRVGRGISAGKGKTAGRGTKGQKSRTGAKRKPGFEGGQNPLMQRLPKLPGFRSRRSKPETVTTTQISGLSGAIDSTKLASEKLITTPHANVKLLYSGPISRKLNVQLQSASKSSIDAISKAGGSYIKTSQLKRSPKEKLSK